MFVQHDDYIINKSQINYIKINDVGVRVTIFFGTKSSESHDGSNLSLRFKSQDEMTDFINKLID